MAKCVLVLHDFIDRMLKFLQRTVQSVCDCQLLEVQPEALDGIEKRTVFGQPDDQQAVFIQAQRRPNRVAMMVGRIVHHQNQVLTGILRQQMFDKSDEGIAVFVRGGEITDASAMPVICAKHVQVVGTAGCWDEFPVSTSHPTAPQRRMQTYGRFVHKEELGVGDGVERDVFFNQSIICAAVSCAGRSCKWLRSCFGSFQRYPSRLMSARKRV